MITAVNAVAAIEKAKERLAALKKQDVDKVAAVQNQITAAIHTMNVPSLHLKGWRLDDSVDWNAEQLAAINAGLAGKSFCLIGAAGTGKTTTLKGIIHSLLMNNVVPAIQGQHETKWLKGGTPGIVLTSFTNMAVRQIAKHFTADITCITIHKLLEFAPVRYTVEDDKGNEINKMVFEPSRHGGNPLPRELKTIVIDESSMVDVDLFGKLLDALPNPHAVQFIFLGDLNQLPPVYGGPILGKKLLELPIIELTQVYRQALLSPIIRYALSMKDGKATPVEAGSPVVEDNGEHGKVTVHAWSKPVGWEDALIKMQGFLKAAIRDSYFDIYKDMVLCPYNVNFGVIELNRAVAGYLGKQRQAKVFEIVAGFNTHYLAVGDKVLASKQEAIIIKITRNSAYSGKRPLNPDIYDIDRHGGAVKRKDALSPAEAFQQENEMDVDAFLLNMVANTDIGKDERVHASSHKIWLMSKQHFLDMCKEHGELDPLLITPDSPFWNRCVEESTWTLDTASEINEMLFGYCITVHKSQGSEWRRVFLITHNSHAKMCSRELLYTAMTRAREELYMIVEPDRGMKAGTLTSGAKKPRLKGNTLAEKLASLKEKFAKEESEAQAKIVVKKEEDEDD